jgi:hypothetical protein
MKRGKKSEEKILVRQITECMEFLIWLKGYKKSDRLIIKRLDLLLQELGRGVQGNGRKTS